MKVLILGGDGFIGSYLAKHHITLKDSVIIVDKNNIRLDPQSTEYTFILQDISNNTREKIRNVIVTYKPDFIYNCIAIANPHYYVKYPIDTFNLDFLVNYEIILEIIQHKIPFIQFSTSEVYGKKWYEPYNEDTTDLVLGPTHKSRWIYATSKILLEQLIISHNTDHCIIRPQNFCGWDMDWLPAMDKNQDYKWKPRLPACLLNSLITNKPIYIVKPGTQKRCYTHIDDAIQALHRVVKNWKKCKGETINIGNVNNETTIENFATLFKIAWSRNITANYQHTKSLEYVEGEDFYGTGYEDCEKRLFDDTKMIKLLKWKPEINLHETVERIVKDSIQNYKFLLK